MELYANRQNVGIVILDDAPQLIRVYEKFFEMAGLKCIASFSNVEELLSFFDPSKTTDPGVQEAGSESSIVVLLDYGVSRRGCNGIATLLRKMNPDLKIILTASENQSKLDIDTKLFDYVIRKPFTISDLFETIRKITSPIRVRGSLVCENPEEMRGLVSDVLSDSRERLCVCDSSLRTSSRLNDPKNPSIYIGARERGLKVQVVTEITKDNMFYCKELMSTLDVQIRHIDGILSNFAVWDGRHSVEAVLASGDSYKLKQFFYSNLEPIASKNQHLFDDLWNKAVPAEQKIRELETSSHPSRVGVISGVEEIAEARIKIVRNSRGFSDGCIVPDWVSKLLNPPVADAFRDAVSRGVNCRQITEITKDNLNSCKELIQMGIDLRHLSKLRGSFALNEEEFMAAAGAEDLQGNKQMSAIYSNYHDFVEQNRSIFNTLWNIAIPASIRIREIEEGIREQKEPSITNYP